MTTQKHIAFTVCSAVVVTVGAIWLAHSADQQTLDGALLEAVQKSAKERSPEENLPNVELESFKYDFGQMAVGEKRTHAFTIRNTGRAPLKMEAGETSCKCTMSKLDKGELPPGETATVELSWKAEEPTDSFKQAALINTNDERHARIRFTITGRVTAVVAVTPSKAWQIGEVLDGRPTEISGSIFSETRDSFLVRKVATSSPHITATVEPLDQSGRDPLKARSGFAIRTVVSPEIPVGPFDETLTIETDVPGYETFTIALYGERPGPLRFIGKRWSVEGRIFHLGNFSAAEGRSAPLSVFLRQAKGTSSTLEVVGTSDPQLKATAKQNSDFESEHQKSYEVTIEIPRGSPAAKRDRSQPGWIELATNLPGHKRFRVAVDFNAF